MRLNQLFLWGSQRCVWFDAGVWVSAVLITHPECIMALISQTCYVVTRSELQRMVNNFQNNSTGFIYSCQHKYSSAGTCCWGGGIQMPFSRWAGYNGAIVDVNVGRTSCETWELDVGAGHFYPELETVKMIYQHDQVMIFSRSKFLEALKLHPNIFACSQFSLKCPPVWQAADNFV